MPAWNDPTAWNRLKNGHGCPLCDWPLSDVIGQTPTALVRVARCAPLPGYVCLVLRRHAVELHDLPPAEATAFVQDVALVSAAVQRITGAAKINLLSLGNLVPHLHVHICPRRPGDRFDGRPLDPGDTVADAYAAGEHERFVRALTEALGESAS